MDRGRLGFFGRLDPVWEVKPSIGARLEKIWRGLPPAEIEPPPEPALGYRGSFLKGPRSRHWFVFGSVVTLRSARRPKSRPESRRDVARKFERTLLASAPANLLPPWLDA